MKKISTLLASLVCIGLLAACSNQKMNSQAQDKKEQTSQQSSQTKQTKAENKSSDAMKTETKAMNQGQAAPDFTLQGVDGKTYKLSDFKGKKVYLKFWASWCSICLASLKDTDEFSKAQEGKDYVVLTVVSPNHMGEKSEEEFKKWYEKLEYKNLTVLSDPSGKLLEEYGVRSYPSSAFIGSDGVLVKKHPGFMEKSAIEQTLQEIK